MRPRLANFHQNEGMWIAIGMSDRIIPNARNSPSSTAQRTRSANASPQTVRRRTGFKSSTSRSIRGSVRMRLISQQGDQSDFGYLLDAVPLQFNESDNLRLR